MKINKITNAQEFFKVVDDCKGRVESVSYTHLRSPRDISGSRMPSSA